jgi:hypothetical protein
LQKKETVVAELFIEMGSEIGEGLGFMGISFYKRCL